MIEKLEFTGNQRFQFERFEAVHSVLWTMQKRSKWKTLISCKTNSSFMIGIHHLRYTKTRVLYG